MLHLPNCRPADCYFFSKFQLQFYGSYWCSWNSCIMNEVPEGFLRILMLSTYFIQLISTSHLDVFAFYLLMTPLSQFICSFMKINIVFPRPKETFYSCCIFKYDFIVYDIRGLLEKYPTVFFYANTWWIII
jgi:hypothetical protein